MTDVMGIVNLVGNNYPIAGLTEHRPLATVPFGSRYRLIDFALSGLLNSGIDNVGVLAPRQQKSLLDHLRSGKDWRLARKKDGLTLLLPVYEQLQEQKVNEINNLYSNLEYLHKSSQNLVLVLPGSAVSNFDFKGALRSHRKTGADITLLYKLQPQEENDCDNHIGLELAADGRVEDIIFKAPSGAPVKCFWGAFILHKELLAQLVKDGYGDGAASLLEAMAPMLGKLKIRAYHYSGFLARIHCLQSYYKQNMKLVDPEIWRQLFEQPGQIRTKSRDESPTKYGEHADVSQAIIASGCCIQGLVDHSVLFRRIVVDKGASVRNSVLMSNTSVAQDAILEYVICDKDVRITAGQVLKGLPDQPLVLKKGSVI